MPKEIVQNSSDTMVIDATKAKLIGKRRLVTLPQWSIAWIVLIPSLIFLTLFMLYPVINTFLFAFVQGDLVYSSGQGSFALGQYFADLEGYGQAVFGFGNFAHIFRDPANNNFIHAIRNTAELVIIEVPLTIIIALLIATFLNSIKVLKGFYQTVFFLPYVTNAIALGLVFNIAFKGNDGGLVNIVLKNVFNVDPINWLDDYSSTRLSQAVVIVTYSIWNGIAFKILVFMSGLATIDKQYYDAAKIDGASSFTIWKRITLPLLSPQILYITITSFIGAFKMYTGVMAVYPNGDAYFFGTAKGAKFVGEEWITVVGWIYKQIGGQNTMGSLQPGYTSAASLVLLGIIMVITVLQFAVSKKRVHY